MTFHSSLGGVQGAVAYTRFASSAPLKQRVHNLDVRLLMARLVARNRRTYLAQSLVAVLRCVRCRVAVADLQVQAVEGPYPCKGT